MRNDPKYSRQNEAVCVFYTDSSFFYGKEGYFCLSRIGTY